MIEPVNRLYRAIVSDLEAAGDTSPYRSDANEPDPRYKSYGVRAPEKKRITQSYRQTFLDLSTQERVALAKQLIVSEFGEQQSVALSILDSIPEYFSPSRFHDLDTLVRHLHGWSKIDAYTGSLLSRILFNYPSEFIDLASRWNHDEDMWLRRASVVLFTRKVAESGRFHDHALQFCHQLIFDPELLVKKGVGWALKDLMRSDKPRVLDFVQDLRRKGVSSTITLYAIKDLPDKERKMFLNSTH